MKNCWSYSINTFLEREGFIVARLTRRSSNKPIPFLGLFGKFLIFLGVILLNMGFLLVKGRWLHSYHCDNPSGPFTSYEPLKGKILKYPPYSFDGEIVQKQTLK